MADTIPFQPKDYINNNYTNRHFREIDNQKKNIPRNHLHESSSLIKQQQPAANKPVNHNNADNIDNLITLASLIAKKYSLNPHININKILRFVLNKSSINDAPSEIMRLINDDDLQSLSPDELKIAMTNQLENLAKKMNANETLQDNRNDKTKEEEIEECKLELLLLQNENESDNLYKKLAKLADVDQRVIELWLAEAEGNIGKIQELIYDNVNLDKVPDSIMMEKRRSDIKKMLNIDIYKSDYEDFKCKENDERNKFIKLLVLKKGLSGTCKVSEIYVASMLFSFAVFEKNMDIIKALLELKADPRIKDLKCGSTSISYVLLKKDFIKEFLNEVVKDKYSFTKCKAKCDDAMSNDLRFIEEDKNRHWIMQKLRQIYYFKDSDNDDDSS